MSLRETLLNMDVVCKDAIEWVADKNLQEAWATCPRGDWMLWWAEEADADIRELALAKSRCAKLVFSLMEHEHSRKAVKVGISFGLGRATRKQLDAAAAAAANVYADAGSYAGYAAGASAYAAAAGDYHMGAYAAAYAAAGAGAAAYDAAGAYAPVYNDTYKATRQKILRECAEICRQVWPQPPRGKKLK